MLIKSNYIIKQIIISKNNYKLLFILPITKFNVNLVKILWSIQYVLGYTNINSLFFCVYLQKIQYKLKNLFYNLKNKFKNNINFKKLYAINTIQPNIFIIFSNKHGLQVYNVKIKDGGILIL